MNRHSTCWERLTRIARAAAPTPSAHALPAGFSERIARNWLSERACSPQVSPWETFALRALAIACLITVGAAATAWPALKVPTSTPDPFDDLADPIGTEILPR